MRYQTINFFVEVSLRKTENMLIYFILSNIQFMFEFQDLENRSGISIECCGFDHYGSRI